MNHDFAKRIFEAALNEHQRFAQTRKAIQELIEKFKDEADWGTIKLTSVLNELNKILEI